MATSSALKIDTWEDIERLLFPIRVYVIPIIGALLIILLAIFIYFPNVSGIFTDVQILTADNAKLSNLESKIVLYKGLATYKNQNNLNANLVTMNLILPDQSKSADIVNTLQALITQDGLTNVDASGQLIQTNNFFNFTQLSQLVKISQISFHIRGTSDKAKQLLDDVSHLQQAAFISDVTMQGNLNATDQDDITFTVNFFSMNSADIINNLSLLSPIRTNYTTKDLANL